jgi:hypothetical protein
MSLMESAPATIPATSATIFAVAFAPPFAATWTRSVGTVASPHRMASASTAASPAHDTRFVLLSQVRRAFVRTTHRHRSFRRWIQVHAERTARSVEGMEWLAHERPSGSFLRHLNLGDGVDPEHISAD